ncbi:branched-chain amino acid ABC transporter substrate-binding protein [Laribacter hongkongensis]|mgnify:CR=1 FL=1|uniref:Branched-chain amino acid ABC transporter substrate-binding protein n=2 Tax=Laribacter hongkongensis TaxID=168471 RepID=A0AAP2SPI9_9NEIS|nr:branched-chain amino acid ABC transporter substrate-binding protein [Laribacter hongkongensis]MCG8992453.1 branched-chain amino acid ABC transporter substrate-binding protein [Laribacter hongkongensis]MCG8994645.1 branched-chain amino acid ABC transporter substrate-binding protein [Laribacter hongkongensis]MCG8998085.1 branched-chain amino acid ABC transporter substrate-binding protein [Laribacter hongkongensis]MCG8999923.1 branched-chain amino acid ABC transporter substrate-binding protein 
MTQTPRLALTAVALATVMALSACGKQEQSAGNSAAPAATDGTTTVKIGFSAPLTGPQAHYGEEYKNGVTLAIEDVNAEQPKLGGQPVKFELVAEDDQADPKTATQIAQKFVDAKVNGIIGHFNSGTAIPASKIYADAGIPGIAMATAPAYTQQGFATAFRSMTSDTQQGGVMGQWVVEKLGKNVVIIDDRTAYGQGLADEFEKSVKAAGGNVLKREFTNDKATDFTAILTTIKGTNPDVVFYGGADAQSAPMAKQMKRLGLKAPLVSGEMTKTPTFLQLAGSDAEGTVASLAGLPLDQMPKGKDYETRYKARFNQDVATYSPYGYDATRVLVAAMQKADSADPAKYLPELAKIQHSGVTSSNWAYDSKGDLKDGGITVYKVQNGAWTVVESVGGK